eukprot:CAMPEP_0195068014 /NCGR_PEP_ID=MMETSP0448-20130528/12888_1 /TAXON_ID=66468 /ORGANISM="Heterocapsa triquestra, Strain CCMP 448" /LENGTH=341 /DNA_ID=CAMNT_0040099515 /DNA_START=241 /DNA_END=1263 /DNA_ORIENTATION=-
MQARSENSRGLPPQGAPDLGLYVVSCQGAVGIVALVAKTLLELLRAAQYCITTGREHPPALSTQRTVCSSGVLHRLVHLARLQERLVAALAARIIVKHALRVELQANHELAPLRVVAGVVESLDDAVRSMGHRHQVGPQVLRGLMMIGVHEQLVRPVLQAVGKPLRQRGVRRNRDGVAEAVVVRLAAVTQVPDGAVGLSLDVADEGAAPEAVEHLRAAAERQDGNASSEGKPHQGKLQLVLRDIQLRVARELLSRLIVETLWQAAAVLEQHVIGEVIALCDDETVHGQVFGQLLKRLDGPREDDWCASKLLDEVQVVLPGDVHVLVLAQVPTRHTEDAWEG